MNVTLVEILLFAFAAFRLTRLFVYDEITAPIRRLFLEEVEHEREVYLKVKEGKVRGFFGKLLSCYWCTGIWAAIILVFGFIFFPGIFTYVIFILAIAGLSSFIETIVQRFIY